MLALSDPSNNFLDAHAGLFPIELALKKATHRASIHLLTLLPVHPLHKIVQDIKKKPATQHASPIANLLRIFKLSHVATETILPVVHYAVPISKFTTKILTTRKDSIKFKKNDTADFKVFSDGSGQNDGIGAAAILYKKG